MLGVVQESSLWMSAALSDQHPGQNDMGQFVQETQLIANFESAILCPARSLGQIVQVAVTPGYPQPYLAIFYQRWAYR